MAHHAIIKRRLLPSRGPPMAHFFTCLYGHRWQAAEDGATGDLKQAAICPVCGTPGQHAAPSDSSIHPEGTLDDLPPPPQASGNVVPPVPRSQKKQRVGS